jgi:ATP-dependent DNA helicase RecG
LIILGLDEEAGACPVGVDPKPLAQALAGACHDYVEPSIRAGIDIVEVDGVPVAVAVIPALSASRRPCFVRAQGMERGSYTRGHDGDRHLTTYEVHAMMAGRGQPRDDVAPVPEASARDFDPASVSRLVERLRRTRGPVFAEQDEATVLRMVGALASDEASDRPTLAGLICLGRYPQQFLPQLNITFVAYPTADARPLPDGTRFLDNQALDGPVPLTVDMAERVLIRNMTRRGVIGGAGRENVWEYPLPAVRELIVNAVMHRDYHPLAQGTQIRVELYPDRLAVTSPGGLFGLGDTDALTHTPISSSRNSTLARLLEDVEMPHGDRTVAENRGTGLIAVSAELERAGMPPARIKATLTHFTVELRRQETGGSTASARARAPSPKTAASPTRRQDEVLRLLRGRERPAADLAAALGISRQAVLKHLRALEDQGLVEPTSNNRQSKALKWRAG